MDEAAATRAGSALTDLVHEGVSVWLDGVTRRSLADGALARLVAESRVTGAVLPLRELGREVREGTAYRAQLEALGGRGVGAEVALRALHRHDVRRACDVFAAQFVSTRAEDGWVCAELDPRTADDARGSLAEARALAAAVDRPNLLITVPGTAAGLEVVSGCLAEGIGVNISHLYSPRRYEDAADASFEGLERALAAGRPMAPGSVASFGAARMEAALGEGSAPALARVVYHLYEERLGTSGWRRLRKAGARPQRLLWPEDDAAADRTERDRTERDRTERDRTERDRTAAVHRVEDLVAWNTVRTMSLRTLDAVARQARLRGDTLSGEPLVTAAQGYLTGLRIKGAGVEEVAGEVAVTALREQAEDRAALVNSLQERPR
ncbi:transaldolase family protein [Streptomyces sp. NPDC048442]|uniref:transaldolase family protein n=1 Tax=Streptomyces sp. NPDC048442 TaxID=3154823 RepID=UPI003412792E